MEFRWNTSKLWKYQPLTTTIHIFHEQKPEKTKNNSTQHNTLGNRLSEACVIPLRSSERSPWKQTEWKYHFFCFVRLTWPQHNLASGKTQENTTPDLHMVCTRLVGMQRRSPHRSSGRSGGGWGGVMQGGRRRGDPPHPSWGQVIDQEHVSVCVCVCVCA